MEKTVKMEGRMKETAKEEDEILTGNGGSRMTAEIRKA